MEYARIEACLMPTPYQLPERFQVVDRLKVVLEREARTRERLATAIETLRASGLFAVVRPYEESREIFESNSLEGLGPDLRATHQILAGADSSIEDTLAVLTMAEDPDLLAVIGMHGARLLVERIRSQGGGWTEYDLRSLHSMICEGEDYAGMYKRYHVRIGGPDAHEPVLPIDVPATMHSLVTWLNECDRSVSASVRAAVAHAWLTHIHPFEDGNGRVARLLANSVLQRSGMPPAIVKASSQRGAYLDALRYSDEGGDIFPLMDLFISTAQRYVRELSKPATLEGIIDRELAGRSDNDYERWARAFREFESVFVAELKTQRLSVKHHGFLDAESFQYIQTLNARGNAWLLSVLDEEDHELLLWFGYPTPEIRNRIRGDRLNPAIFFSVRNDGTFGYHPFRGVRSELEGLTQIAVYAGVPDRFYALVNDQVRVGGVRQSAADVAAIVGRAFRARNIPLEKSLTAFPRVAPPAVRQGQ